MAGTKYGKYVVKHDLQIGDSGPSLYTLVKPIINPNAGIEIRKGRR